MGKNDMTFLEHLEELRWHIIRSLIVIIILTGVAFMFKTIVFDTVFIGPSKAGFITNKLLCNIGICINKEDISLQNLRMSGQFMTHIKISIYAGLILGFPYLIFEIWRFVKPALYSKEQRIARYAIFFISLLFFLGVLFGYFIICPLSINFLINYQVAETVVNKIKLYSYISTISSIIFSSGLLFQLPVIVYTLSRIGIVNPQILKKYRRHALVIILIASAIITPPDIFSQVLVSIPVLLLYEVGILISKRIVKNNAG